MESWCVQLSIDVPYVSIGAVVVSLDAPKHQTVTSLGHVCDPSCSNSDHTAGPHWANLMRIFLFMVRAKFLIPLDRKIHLLGIFCETFDLHCALPFGRYSVANSRWQLK